MVKIYKLSRKQNASEFLNSNKTKKYELFDNKNYKDNIKKIIEKQKRKKDKQDGGAGKHGQTVPDMGKYDYGKSALFNTSKASRKAKTQFQVKQFDVFTKEQFFWLKRNIYNTIRGSWLLHKFGKITKQEHELLKRLLKAHMYFARIKLVMGKLYKIVIKLYGTNESIIRKLQRNIRQVFDLQMDIENAYKNPNERQTQKTSISKKIISFFKDKIWGPKTYEQFVKTIIEQQDKIRKKIMKQTVFDNTKDLGSGCNYSGIVLGAINDKYRKSKKLICAIGRYRKYECKFNKFYYMFREQYKLFIRVYPACDGTANTLVFDAYLNIDEIDEKKKGDFYYKFDPTKCESYNLKINTDKLLDETGKMLKQQLGNGGTANMKKEKEIDAAFKRKGIDLKNLMVDFTKYINVFKKMFQNGESYGIRHHHGLPKKKKFADRIFGKSEKSILAKPARFEELAKEPTFIKEFTNMIKGFSEDVKSMFQPDNTEKKIKTTIIPYIELYKTYSYTDKNDTNENFIVENNFSVFSINLNKIQDAAYNNNYFYNEDLFPDITTIHRHALPVVVCVQNGFINRGKDSSKVTNFEKGFLKDLYIPISYSYAYNDEQTIDYKTYNILYVRKECINNEVNRVDDIIAVDQTDYFTLRNIPEGTGITLEKFNKSFAAVNFNFGSDRPTSAEYVYSYLDLSTDSSISDADAAAEKLRKMTAPARSTETIRIRLDAIEIEISGMTDTTSLQTITTLQKELNNLSSNPNTSPTDNSKIPVILKNLKNKEDGVKGKISKDAADKAVADADAAKAAIKTKIEKIIEDLNDNQKNTKYTSITKDAETAKYDGFITNIETLFKDFDRKTLVDAQKLETQINDLNSQAVGLYNTIIGGTSPPPPGDAAADIAALRAEAVILETQAQQLVDAIKALKPNIDITTYNMLVAGSEKQFGFYKTSIINLNKPDTTLPEAKQIINNLKFTIPNRLKQNLAAAKLLVKNVTLPPHPPPPPPADKPTTQEKTDFDKLLQPLSILKHKLIARIDTLINDDKQYKERVEAAYKEYNKYLINIDSISKTILSQDIAGLRLLETTLEAIETELNNLADTKFKPPVQDEAFVGSGGALPPKKAFTIVTTELIGSRVKDLLHIKDIVKFKLRELQIKEIKKKIFDTNGFEPDIICGDFGGTIEAIIDPSTELDFLCELYKTKINDISDFTKIKPLLIKFYNDGMTELSSYEIYPNSTSPDFTNSETNLISNYIFFKSDSFFKSNQSNNFFNKSLKLRKNITLIDIYGGILPILLNLSKTAVVNTIKENSYIQSKARDFTKIKLYDRTSLEKIIRMIDKLMSHFTYGYKAYLKRDLGCFSFQSESGKTGSDYSIREKKENDPLTLKNFYTMNYPSFIDVFLYQVSGFYNKTDTTEIFYSENQISRTEIKHTTKEQLNFLKGEGIKNQSTLVQDTIIRMLLIPSKELKLISAVDTTIAKTGIDYDKTSAKDYMKLAQQFSYNFYRNHVIPDLESKLTELIYEKRTTEYSKDDNKYTDKAKTRVEDDIINRGLFYELLQTTPITTKDGTEIQQLVNINNPQLIERLFEFIFIMLKLKFIDKQVADIDKAQMNIEKPIVKAEKYAIYGEEYKNNANILYDLWQQINLKPDDTVIDNIQTKFLEILLDTLKILKETTKVTFIINPEKQVLQPTVIKSILELKNAEAYIAYALMIFIVHQSKILQGTHTQNPTNIEDTLIIDYLKNINNLQKQIAVLITEDKIAGENIKIEINSLIQKYLKVFDIWKNTLIKGTPIAVAAAAALFGAAGAASAAGIGLGHGVGFVIPTINDKQPFIDGIKTTEANITNYNNEITKWNKFITNYTNTEENYNQITTYINYINTTFRTEILQKITLVKNLIIEANNIFNNINNPAEKAIFKKYEEDLKTLDTTLFDIPNQLQILLNKLKKVLFDNVTVINKNEELFNNIIDTSLLTTENIKTYKQHFDHGIINNPSKAEIYKSLNRILFVKENELICNSRPIPDYCNHKIPYIINLQGSNGGGNKINSISNKKLTKNKNINNKHKNTNIKDNLGQLGGAHTTIQASANKTIIKLQNNTINNIIESEFNKKKNNETDIYVLNFGHVLPRGGNVMNGDMGEEEELCRTSPQFYNSLNSIFDKLNKTYIAENVHFIRHDGCHSKPYEIINNIAKPSANIISMFIDTNKDVDDVLEQKLTKLLVDMFTNIKNNILIIGTNIFEKLNIGIDGILNIFISIFNDKNVTEKWQNNKIIFAIPPKPNLFETYIDIFNNIITNPLHYANLIDRFELKIPVIESSLINESNNNDMYSSSSSESSNSETLNSDSSNSEKSNSEISKSDSSNQTLKPVLYDDLVTNYNKINILFNNTSVPVNWEIKNLLIDTTVVTGGANTGGGKISEENQNMWSDYASEVKPIVSEKFVELLKSFIKIQSDKGNELYKDGKMTPTTLITRLLTERPHYFYGKDDTWGYFNKDNKLVEGIGIENLIKDTYKNFLTYDEIALSALISVSVPTKFINDGNRNNRGKLGKNDTYYKDKAIYTACVGPRLEKENVMEYSYMVVTRTQNTVANGYSNNVTAINALLPESVKTLAKEKRKILRMWAEFYGYVSDMFPTWNEMENVTDNYMGFNRINDNLYFSSDIYKKRLTQTILPFLYNANDYCKKHSPCKKAFLRVVGLGTEYWSGEIDKKTLDQYMVDLYKELLAEHKFDNISCIEFIDSQLDEQKLNFGGIDFIIKKESGNPAEPLPKEYKDDLLVAMYNCNGNSYPGNEFWSNNHSTSEDPAACCSMISILQNPDINPTRLTGEATYIIECDDLIYSNNSYYSLVSTPSSEGENTSHLHNEGNISEGEISEGEIIHPPNILTSSISNENNKNVLKYPVLSKPSISNEGVENSPSDNQEILNNMGNIPDTTTLIGGTLIKTKLNKYKSPKTKSPISQYKVSLKKKTLKRTLRKLNKNNIKLSKRK